MRLYALRLKAAPEKFVINAKAPKTTHKTGPLQEATFFLELNEAASRLTNRSEVAEFELTPIEKKVTEVKCFEVVTREDTPLYSIKGGTPPAGFLPSDVPGAWEYWPTGRFSYISGATFSNPPAPKVDGCAVLKAAGFTQVI